LSEELERSQRLLDAYKRKKEAEEAKRIFDLLPQGSGSGLDADTVDGLHAKEIIAKASVPAIMGGGGGGGVTDHGALIGLADDDHTQYLPVDGSRPVTHHIDISEVAPPANPAADRLRLYVEDFHGFPFYSFRDATGMVRKIVRDSVFVAKNESGSDIAANQAVYATGGAVDVPTIDLAKADAIATMPSIGVTVEAIADGAYGRVMQVGLLENVNTNAFNAGDVLYVSAAVAGAPTDTPPAYPNIRQEMGTVLVKDAVVGSVQLIARSMTNEGNLDHGGLIGLADDDHPQYMKEITYDADADDKVDVAENAEAIDGKTVNAAAPADKQFLQFNFAADEWTPVDPDVTIVDVNIPAQTTTLGVTTIGENRVYDHAFFNAAADGALVAAVGGKVIKVHAITLQAAGTVVVNIRSNNAAGTILASWTFQAREGAIYGFAPYPAHWFQTAVGEALFVDVTAAVNVTINCIYTDDDAS